jgi:hypothetical protein
MTSFKFRYPWQGSYLQDHSQEGALSTAENVLYISQTLLIAFLLFLTNSSDSELLADIPGLKRPLTSSWPLPTVPDHDFPSKYSH